MSRRQSPNTAVPVVQRIRLRYTKSGRMRFASHRDFQRALERAVRRADVPIAYSGGFNPHPRISYANAAPTGAASQAEYVELGLAEPRDPQPLAHALTQALPAGFTIAAAWVGQSGSIADQLSASEWELRLPGVAGDTLAAAVTDLLARAPVTVPRMTKSGLRDIPVTACWVDHDVSDACLRVLVRHDTPGVRPEDVVTALGVTPTAPPVFTRLAQGELVGDPAVVVGPGH